MTTQTPPTPDTPETAPKLPWIRPEVCPVGTVGEILKAGTGKTTATRDPMEPVGFEGPDL